MNFDNLISMVRMLGEERAVWLTDSTFNQLRKLNFRANKKNNFIISSDDIELEISVEGRLESECVTSFVKVERMSEVFPGTQLIKGDIYISPKISQKLSIIL